jgi:hypothetical protein
MATDFTMEQLASQSASVEAAVKLAVRDALIQHKRTGNPICVWRDGKVVWIPADEIQIDEEPNGG